MWLLCVCVCVCVCFTGIILQLCCLPLVPAMCTRVWWHRLNQTVALLSLLKKKERKREGKRKRGREEGKKLSYSPDFSFFDGSSFFLKQRIKCLKLIGSVYLREYKLFFFFLPFLWPYCWHMEVPRLGVKSGAVAVSHSNSVSKPRLMATPDSQPTEWSQGSNPHPHGY